MNPEREIASVVSSTPFRNHAQYRTQIAKKLKHVEITKECCSLNIYVLLPPELQHSTMCSLFIVQLLNDLYTGKYIASRHTDHNHMQEFLTEYRLTLAVYNGNLNIGGSYLYNIVSQFCDRYRGDGTCVMPLRANALYCELVKNPWESSERLLDRIEAEMKWHFDVAEREWSAGIAAFDHICTVEHVRGETHRALDSCIVSDIADHIMTFV